MFARRFPRLPLVLAGLLVACLATGAFKAHAVDRTISTSVTTTNGGNTLNDDDRLIIDASGAITITTANVDAINSARRLTIINNGSLTTSGNDSEAIQVQARNTITHNGSIITRGLRSQGILVLNNNTITLGPDSTITTDGNDSEGINAQARIGNNTISNSGSITTSGNNSAGISAGIVNGIDNTLTLNGEITTEGSGSHGVVTGTGTTLNTIGRNSRIKIMAADADGLRIGGLAASQTTLTHEGQIDAGGTGIRLPYVQTFENSGKIAGRGGDGIFFTATTARTATLTNSGTIEGQMHGVNYGVHAIGNLNNSGTIKGGTGAGVTFTGTASGPVTVINTGTIQGGTYGLDYGTNTIQRLTNTSPRSLRGGSQAALRAGALLNLDNRGAIISAQASAIQLTRTTGQAAKIANSGTIRGAVSGLDYGMNDISSLTNSDTIQGGSGPALQARAIGTLNNTGTIRSTGGPAIQATGLSKLTNSGTIEGQTGIRLTRRTGMASNTMIDNAGTLRSLQGAAGKALDLIGPGQDTLRLRAGSTFEGQIHWDGEDGDLLLLDSLGPTRLTFIDNNAAANEEPTVFNIKAPTGLLVFKSTTTSNNANEARTVLTLLDPARTDPRTDATQSLWTGAVFQSLAQQQAQMRHKGSARHRSGHDVSHSALWVRPFGGLQNYRREDETPAARYRYGGALAGYGMATAEWQAGAFLGAARSELRRRGQGAEAEGREMFLGAYGQTRWQALKVSVAVLFGKSRNETEWLWGDNRVSGGLERREYTGKHTFISPELGLSTHLDMGGYGHDTGTEAALSGPL